MVDQTRRDFLNLIAKAEQLPNRQHRLSVEDDGVVVHDGVRLIPGDTIRAFLTAPGLVSNAHDTPPTILELISGHFIYLPNGLIQEKKTEAEMARGHFPLRAKSVDNGVVIQYDMNGNIQSAVARPHCTKPRRHNDKKSYSVM